MNASRLDETAEGMRQGEPGETQDSFVDSKPDEADKSGRDSCWDNGEMEMGPPSPVRWMPRLLTGLVVLCLGMAAWVWYEILRLGL